MGDIDREMLRVRCLIGVPMISQDFLKICMLWILPILFVQFYFNNEIYSNSCQCLLHYAEYSFINFTTVQSYATFTCM